MSDQRQIYLRDLQTRVAAGEYHVDPRSVADAIVRRAWVHSAAPRERPIVAIVSRRSRRRRAEARTKDYARAA